MLYRVTYADGSQEVVDADDISDARETAEELYDIPIRRVVAEETPEDDPDLDPVEDEEDDSLEDALNPDGEDEDE